MVEIRKAIMEDLEDIRKLNQELFAYENENFDDTINIKWSLGEGHKKDYVNAIKNNFCFVALVDGKIVGYIVGYIQKPETYRNIGKLAELDNMSILREYRSKGIGSKLVKEFKKWAKSNGVDRLRVTASVRNLKAIKFYRREGFGDYDLSLEQKIK